MQILLIEDNESIIEGLTYSFKNAGLSIISARTINEAKKILNSELKNRITLIILDITLPDGSGFNLFKDYIKDASIPTIFLTAKDDENDIVAGLNIGAEDYLTKPFSTKELLARVNKILLRKNQKEIIKIKDITFDLDKMVVYKDDKKIEISSLELKILHLLFLNLNKVVRRGTILDKLWEWTGNDVDDHTLTVYVNRLREKLKTDIIVTIKGIGYRIDEE